MNFKRRHHEDLFVEEAIADSLAFENERVEMPIAAKVFLIVAGALVLITGVTFGRVFYVNIWNGVFYEARAEANVNREVRLPAPRGLITDRYGKVIAENAASFSAVFRLNDFLKKGGDLEVLLTKLSEILEVPLAELRELANKSNLEKRTSVIIGRSLSLEKVIALKSLNDPAVEVRDDYIREYPQGQVFAHVVGYTGLSGIDDSVEGKTGLEAFYDEHLRGRDGSRIFYKNATGDILEEKLLAEPMPGRKIKTTLDFELQTFFYERMRKGLAAVGSYAGVGMAINPQTGEMLSLLSFPSFDNNVFAQANTSKERRQLLESNRKPLFNRAISGLYNPGSTIKPLVGLAALVEGVVDVASKVFSAGFIEIPNPYFPDQPSRFLDWKAHGWVDIHSALARSSNVYFYAAGGGFPAGVGSSSGGEIKGLGIEKLNSYWETFRLNQKTGIDLISEVAGFLPNAEEKEERTGQIWRIGDTYNVAIGQGDLLVTPIELLNFIASLGAGGVMRKPYVVEEVYDDDGGIVIKNAPEIIAGYTEWKDQIVEIQKGLEDAVSKPYGTANLLVYTPMKIAAKTGSAQYANNTKTHAFIVGYAPAENPTIAFLVLVEDAKEGSLNAVPIAKDVLDWYYEHRIESNPKLQMHPNATN